MRSSQERRRTSARSRGAAASQAGWAAAAAAAAARASSAPPLATVAMTSSVAGSWTSNRSPDAAGRHSPPMNRSVRFTSSAMAPVVPRIAQNHRLDLTPRPGRHQRGEEERELDHAHDDRPPGAAPGHEADAQQADAHPDGEDDAGRRPLGPVVAGGEPGADDEQQQDQAADQAAEEQDRPEEVGVSVEAGQSQEGVAD